MDQAALRAAKDGGLAIGGWCPPGRVCEAGVIPAEFPLQETEQERSPDAPDIPRSQRTEWNVRDSDGTLVITRGLEEDRGTKWAIECATRYGRPLLVCDVDDPNAGEKIGEWLAANDLRVVSVGGPSESSAPGIGQRVSVLLREVFFVL